MAHREESLGRRSAMAAVLDEGYGRRMRAALGWRPFATVSLLAGVASTQIFFQPDLFAMWDWADIALGWLDHFGNAWITAMTIWLAVVAVEPLQRPRAVAARAALVFVATFVPILLFMWLLGWYHTGQWQPASVWNAVSVAVKCAALGGCVYAVRAAERHAVRAHAQALSLKAAHRELQREAAEAQLQLLQAQIEPHFLFNTLANVRRLYRKQPAAGALAIDNLMQYLRAALPQVRRADSTLGEEFELVRAYLELFQVRMGARLRYSLVLPAALRNVSFAPMVLVTLVENAIKHGLAPAGGGGTITVSARQDGQHGEVSVADSGVGFGPDTGGHGVGLTNIWRQLAARHGDAASLTLEERAGGGVLARIRWPLVPQQGHPAPPAAAWAAGAA
jgi:signal transduction histidine kinase